MFSINLRSGKKRFGVNQRMKLWLYWKY